jgi:hypothetical protein
MNKTLTIIIALVIILWAYIEWTNYRNKSLDVMRTLTVSSESLDAKQKALWDAYVAKMKAEGITEMTALKEQYDKKTKSKLTKNAVTNGVAAATSVASMLLPPPFNLIALGVGGLSKFVGLAQTTNISNKATQYNTSIQNIGTSHYTE